VGAALADRNGIIPVKLISRSFSALRASATLRKYSSRTGTFHIGVPDLRLSRPFGTHRSDARTVADVVVTLAVLRVEYIGGLVLGQWAICRGRLKPVRRPNESWHSTAMSANRTIEAETCGEVRNAGPVGPPKSVSFLGTNLMKFRPLHDRVVVRRLDAEEKTAGGIIIPETAQEKPMEGEIIAVGPGARNEQGQIVALDVKAGDRILFGKWSGTEVKLDGQELLIMKESDIMGIIEGAPAAKKKAA